MVTNNPIPENDQIEEVQTDSGQSSFWENQAISQAPPMPELPPHVKKRRMIITIVLISLFSLMIIALAMPKKPRVKKIIAPDASATPSAQPASKGWEAEFAIVDEQLKDSDSETITTPPQTDMLVEF